MQVARVRPLLWLGTALAAAGAVAAVLAAAALPLDAPADPPDKAPGSAGAAVATGAPELPPLASFESAWQKPLRRPLVDPPPAVAAEPVKPPRPLIRLVGTIVDDRRPRGIFLVGLNGMELRGPGEKAGGADVVRIDDNSAVLRLNGEEFTVRRERSPFDPTGGPDAPTAARAGPDDGS